MEDTFLVLVGAPKQKLSSVFLADSSVFPDLDCSRSNYDTRMTERKASSPAE